MVLHQSELSQLSFPGLVKPRTLDLRPGALWKCTQIQSIGPWYGGSTRTGNSSLVGGLEIDRVSPGFFSFSLWSVSKRTVPPAKKAVRLLFPKTERNAVKSLDQPLVPATTLAGQT